MILQRVRIQLAEGPTHQTKEMTFFPAKGENERASGEDIFLILLSKLLPKDRRLEA